ncbi:MAG: hypothetical protein WCX93_13535 [Burkholderiaceae bacterium]
MWDFSIGRSVQLLLRTLPFLLLRCAVYFGIALGYVLITGVGAGLGWAIGALGTPDFQATTTAVGAFGGFAMTAAILYLLREYLLYMLKAGHIAVLVMLMDGQELPKGKSQISHATEVVKSRFSNANALFALDLIIKGVVRAISGLAHGMLTILPIPGVQQLSGVIRAFLRVAVGLTDEIILAYTLRTESDTPWHSAQNALILYGQNARNLLKNAAWLTAFNYALAFIVFIIMLVPAAGLAWLMPGSLSAISVIFAILLAWAFKVAILEPFAIACLMQAYFKAIEGQTPDPVWEQRLESASGKFRELKDKAKEWGTRPSDSAPEQSTA